MRYSTLFTLASGAAAQFRGFNYGNLDLDGSPRTQQDFENQFKAAKALPGTDGKFTAARLFTMIQAGTSGDLISAIQAAVDTDTTLLLGLWGSAGQQAFDLELAALQFAIDNFGEELGSRVAGISIGSEDLYRNSPTGIKNKSGAGADPEQLVSYIRQVRELIEGTALSEASLGHVDTWTAWVNGSNSAVVEAVDWVGTDAYPYFQTEEANSVDAGADLFFSAYDAVVGASQGKPVWVTETGWPVKGPKSNEAETGTSEAKQYWDAVSCRLQSMDVNFWWFTLDDDQATSDDVSFSLVNPSDLFGEPLFDLSCDAKSSSSSSSSKVASSTAASSKQSSGTSSPTTLTMAVPIYSTPSGSRPATLTPISTSMLTTVISEDVTVSTAAAGPLATGYSSGTTAGGNDTIIQGQPSAPTSSMPVTFDGGAVRAGSVGGFAAFVAGFAAWVL